MLVNFSTATLIAWLALPCLLGCGTAGAAGGELRPTGNVGRTVVQSPPDCPECDRVVARARKLLPRQPERVVVLDASHQSQAMRRRIEESEAFITAGETTV
jgi:hypothetical protein